MLLVIFELFPFVFQPVPFSAAVVCISDRHLLNSDLVRLLFVQAHWKPTICKCADSGGHLVQSNQFHYRPTKSSSHVKSRVGNILAKSHPYCPIHTRSTLSPVNLWLYPSPTQTSTIGVQNPQLYLLVKHLNSKIEFNFKNKKTQFLSSVSLSVCELVCVTESGKERKLDTDNLCMCVCVWY
jgi:hypothetical protein